jgi:D-3-phosphoglycerate dehydrogenase
MVAGTANSPSVAEQRLFMMLTLAKRATEMHSLVRDNKWADRLGMLPYDLFGKTVLIVGFGRIGTRTAKRCLAMEMNVLDFDPYKPAADIKAAGCEPVPTSTPRCRAPTSSASIARRIRRRSACSMPTG